MGECNVERKIELRSSHSSKNYKSVKPNDQIQFVRKGQLVTGVVENIRENTVIVSVDRNTQRTLDLPNMYTVVNHKNYSIKGKKVV